MECASLTFQDQVVLEVNNALAAGGALYVDSSSAMQSINTTYYGNWAAVGGAVYIAGLGTTTVSQTNFTNSTFLSNAANLTSSGGALVYIYECFPGGKDASNMYMWAEPPINDSCSAVRYGAGLAYAPHSIQLIDPSVTLYTSNGSNALDFLLWVTDIAGQNVTAGVSTDLASVSGLEVIVNGSYPLLPLDVPGDYDASFNLTGFPLVLLAFKTIRVQPCSLGRIKSEDNTTCTACGMLTFSLKTSSTTCDACPTGAQCNGSAAFLPPAQYYHSSPYSTNIVSCPNPALLVALHRWHAV
ncbi:hypothetical protein WJX82_006643 [Trebouxia sp. C0006]